VERETRPTEIIFLILEIDRAPSKPTEIFIEPSGATERLGIIFDNFNRLCVNNQKQTSEPATEVFSFPCLMAGCRRVRVSKTAEEIKPRQRLDATCSLDSSREGFFGRAPDQSLVRLPPSDNELTKLLRR
jgi:hypothetical protein